MENTATEIPKVAIAIIRNSIGQFLISKRPLKAAMAGKWEFAGGKLEPGETGFEAAHREIFEELGIRIHIRKLYHEQVISLPHGDFFLIYYLCDMDASQKPKAIACERFLWLDPNSLPLMDFLPADIGLIPRLQKEPL